MFFEDGRKEALYLHPELEASEKQQAASARLKELNEVSEPTKVLVKALVKEPVKDPDLLDYYDTKKGKQT